MALKPAAAPPPPRSRDAWVAEFVHVAREAVPTLPLRFTNAVAYTRSTDYLNLDPGDAARNWLAEKST